MSIAQRLLKEFWLPTLVAIAWTIYNLSTQTSAWDVKSLVNLFGPTFFLASWATGQFFRVKKQANLDNNLLSIESRVTAVINRLEQHTKDFLGYTTGGDSIGYFIVGISAPETLELMFHNPSQYPVFDVYAEAIDLDEPIDPKINKWWTRHGFALEKIYPNKASGGYRFPLTGRDQLRLNVFIHTRTQGVIQQIRVLRKDNWFQIAEMVRFGEKVVKLEVPEGFPGYDSANPNALFN